MKPLQSLSFPVLALALFAAPIAQSQATPPAGATGLCKDGTYTTSATKSGACRGHQGVKEWFATPSTAPAASAPAKPTAETTPAKPAKPASTATGAGAERSSTSSSSASSSSSSSSSVSTAPAAKPAHESTAHMTQAAGGGPGLVWLNTDSNVYHCPGTQYYGKTKQGSYMSEADAKAKGAHADHNHPCTK